MKVLYCRLHDVRDALETFNVGVFVYFFPMDLVFQSSGTINPTNLLLITFNASRFNLCVPKISHKKAGTQNQTMRTQFATIGISGMISPKIGPSISDA